MAKEKKRGFFSWLGLGRQEEKQQQEDTSAQPSQDENAKSGVEDQLPTQEPEHFQQAEMPGEWDASNEQIAEIVPPITDSHESVSADEGVTVAQPQEHSKTYADVTEVTTAVPESQSAALAEEIVELTEKVAEQRSAPHSLLDDAEMESNALAQEIVGLSKNLSQHDDDEEPEWEEEPEQPHTAQHIEPEPVTAAPQEQERPSKEGFFARLKRSLLKTKQNLGSGILGLFRGKKIDDELFEELEEQLLIADVGVETTRKIISSLTLHASRKQLKDAEALYGKLKEEMSEILAKVDQPLDVSGKSPFVILMVGVNGVGKTTTIGKLARQFEAQGKSVMLAAGDTFRAAAVEQLQIWGQRNNIPVIAQHTGADSASVIFDAIQAAKARGADVLIADTAGRLQNKAHLMEELKKIVRVMKKLDEDAPHEVMLTIDASTGQNAVSQVRLFKEAIGLTGITLTKLDGTAKGGVIFSVADQFGIPIRYIGVGEGIDDLRPFKADDFIEALFARED
ncbi:signal recognition particle-docking protein FtsY [Edaphovirga cremea]|uniref:signal recognition particle-docking protein FtsY n=1 Tax=Edaphovirga cremea TaxID=2267246 RepID=UPI003988F9C8